MQKGRGRGVFFAAGASLLALSLLAAAQAPAPKPTPPPGQEKRLPPIDVPRIVPTELPAQCQQARERADQLRAELEASLSPQAKAAAEQYVTKPGPGVSREKAWGDYAAAASLMGDAPVAAWTGLKAAEIRWGGDTATNAGIYLYHLGKVEEALQLLNCAYEMGYRSPYLFEALAVIHQTQGNNAQARQAISEAQQAAPDDTIIETEASFINTGQPPPPRPPQRDPDGLDGAVRELEEHAQRALNLIKIQADVLDHSLPDANARQFQQISADYFTKVIQIARDQARDARAADPSMRQIMINSVLGTCVSNYAQISDTLLSFPDTTETNGSPLLLWADALGLDAPVLARESRREAISWSMHTALGPALAQGAYDDYWRDLEAARKEHNERDRACRDNPCKVREGGRFCGVWKQLYEVWENQSRQRHNTAARQFDRVATRKIIEAENEYLQLRDYAVRQLKKMRFQKTPGYDMEQMTLQGINGAILPVYERHVNPPADASSGTVVYLRERAQWFENERSDMDEMLGQQAEDMQRQCEPALRALLELLLQEEWQAYLDHLRDRIAWDIQPKTESGDCPPGSFSVGPLSVSADPNKLGEGKFEYKWKKGGFSATGSATVGGDQGVTLGGGVGASTRGVGIGVATEGGPSISRSASYGPFAGKAKVTLTSKVNPWNSQEYLGIKLKGSAGFGLKRGGVGADCYPSSGSVTFYPRALYDDAVRYMSTPSTRPSGGGRPR